MPEKPETKLKKRFFKQLLDTFKDRVWFEKIQQVAIRGTPDCLICLPCETCERGLFYGVELKNPGEYPDPLQRSKGLRIERAGGMFLTYRTSADLAPIFERSKEIPLITLDRLKKLVERHVEIYGEEEVMKCLTRSTSKKP